MGLREFRHEIQFVFVVIRIYSEAEEDISAKDPFIVRVICRIYIHCRGNVMEIRYRFIYSAHLHFDCNMFDYVSSGGTHLFIILFSTTDCIQTIQAFF